MQKRGGKKKKKSETHTDTLIQDITGQPAVTRQLHNLYTQIQRALPSNHLHSNDEMLQTAKHDYNLLSLEDKKVSEGSLSKHMCGLYCGICALI